MKYTMHFLTALLLIGASALNGQDFDPESCHAACVEILVAAAERGMESADRLGADPTARYLELRFGMDYPTPATQRLHWLIEERLGLPAGIRTEHPVYRACIADSLSAACTEGGEVTFIIVGKVQMISAEAGTVHVFRSTILDPERRRLGGRQWHQSHGQQYLVEFIDDEWVTTRIGFTVVSE